MTAPRVVGLDLSITATGICDETGDTITVKPRNSGDSRLIEIVAAVAVTTRGADLVVIEEAPPGLKGPAIKAVHMVHGAVRVALLTQNKQIAVINPTTLKRFATGKPGASKTDMALALYKRAGLEFPDDNQVDAWWLRAAGLQMLGYPAVQVPAAQVAALPAAAVTR